MHFNSITYGVIVPSVEHTLNHIPIDERDEWDYDCFVKPNLWLEKQVGFYPLFMAVGTTDDDIGMTGYSRQWAKIIGSRYNHEKKRSTNLLRKKNEFPNDVLFSFNSVEGIFVDYEYWFYALNSGYNDYKVSPKYIKWIFKRSWTKADWLRKTRKNPCSVMFAASQLDLRLADRLWVRNNKTKENLEYMGFSNVQVKRISSDL